MGLRRPQQPEPRGDDVIAQANELIQPTEDEVQAAKFFQDSWQLITKKAKEDEVFGKRVIPKLQRLSGEQFYQGVVDEADNIKIEFLKKQDPQRFNSEAAAVSGFLNTATFGQLSNVYGAVGQLVGDRPFEEIAAEQAEKLRLMQKAFPRSDMVGQVGGYLIPGSPAKALFTRMAGLGSKSTKALLSRLVSDPKHMERIGARIAQSAAAGTAGGAAISTTRRGLDIATEGDLSLDRLKEEAGGIAGESLGAGALGAVIPVLGAAGRAGVQAAAPTVRRGAQAARQTVAKALGQVAGRGPEFAGPLRAARRIPREIKEAAGTQQEIGRDLVSFLQSAESKVIESQQAKELLPQITQKVNISPLIQRLRGAGKGVRVQVDPALDTQVGQLKQWGDRLAKLADKQGNVSAVTANEIKTAIQNSSRVAYGADQELLGTILKKTGHDVRIGIERAAGATPNQAGQTYVQLMRQAAKKTKVLDYIGRRMGRTVEQQEQNAERFIGQMFGKNKNFLQQRMGELDAKFGTNFFERSRLARLAERVGPGGELPPLSAVPTGNVARGTLTGYALGSIGGSGSAGAVVGTLASSPRVASRLLGASDAITGFVRRMFARPDVLRRMAGRVAARGAPGAEKQLTALRIPRQVQEIAGQIEDTLVREGPVSAASNLRLFADTPYFLGLAHYFEILERRHQLDESRQIIEQFKTQPQITREQDDAQRQGVPGQAR